MELQFHPASGRRTVRTLAAGPTAEWGAIVLACLGVLVASSLCVSVPLLAARRLRDEERALAASQARAAAAERGAVAALAVGLRDRGLAAGDLMNRVAFLYDLPASGWPRVLDPQRSWLSNGSPEAVAERLPAYERALDRARAIVAEKENADPGAAESIPSIVPVEAGLVEPAARFGPRVSPWTGEEEFFPGVDIAAPSGSPVLAAGGGAVAFTGNVRRMPGGWLWRLGTVVVISHGKGGATVYGHLARVDVRRGQRVRRGERIGTIGASGWALSPQLHYEYWRGATGDLRPTDPLFASLDRLSGPRFSLEQMLATSAPGPLEPLPGIQVPAEGARGSAEPRSVRRRGRPRRRT
jgi:murein DD-endopeptidase MepM/ murein hydrolase activator NlpD